MSDNSDDGGVLDGEDFYSFLNIPRSASDEEINHAYRRLSRLYHPDKHQNPERKGEAELLFSKTKRAYEVLSDPHMRAIYDSVGESGLSTQGWEVAHRTKTPQEIREEYERLAREREEQRLRARTNPKSTVNITINATEIFITDDDEEFYQPDLRDMFGLPHVEVNGVNISQYIEAPITSKHTAILNGTVASRNGRGEGQLSLSMRRIVSDKTWVEADVGAGSGLSLGFKAYRRITDGVFSNGSLLINFSPNSFKLGSQLTLGAQLDKHTLGYINLKMGTGSGLTTSLVRDTDRYHATAGLNFGVPHSYASLSYAHKFSLESKLKLAGKFGTFGGQVTFGAEKNVSEQSSVSASMSVGVPLGVHLKLKLRRAEQNYSCNVILCDEVLPAPVVYGTLLPVVAWVAVDRLLVRPYLMQRERENLKKQREANRSKLLERKKEAVAAVALMRETVKRITETETAKKGLVIVRAEYGKLVAEDSEEEESLCVTVPVQCLVKDSKLILHESSKSQLPGFYDPCPGEDKSLRVRYMFHGLLHQVTLADTEPLRIPKQSHRVET